jgi:putative hydroxymethylpyrimidine transport system permease protein
MKSRCKAWLEKYGPFAILTLLIGFIWEWSVHRGIIPSFILPAPTAIWLSLMEHRQILFEVHLIATIKEVVIGFVLSVIVGVMLGVCMHFSLALEKLIYPFLVISQTIPLIAISPIFIMWFGYSIWSKVAVTFLIAFFPIVVSTYDGLKMRDTDYSNLLLTMGASRWDIFKKIQIPMALQPILSGLKMAVVYCVVGATIGEWLGASEGLGYFSRRMAGNMEADALFAAVLLLSILGIILFLIISIVEKQILKRIYH